MRCQTIHSLLVVPEFNLSRAKWKWWAQGRSSSANAEPGSWEPPLMRCSPTVPALPSELISLAGRQDRSVWADCNDRAATVLGTSLNECRATQKCYQKVVLNSRWARSHCLWDQFSQRHVHNAPNIYIYIYISSYAFPFRYSFKRNKSLTAWKPLSVKSAKQVKLLQNSTLSHLIYFPSHTSKAAAVWRNEHRIGIRNFKAIY